MKRRAVLIGVTGYEGTHYKPIPAAADVNLLTRAFSTLGFQVDTIQYDLWTRNRLLGSISKSIAQAAPGEHLVVYVSSHGLHIAGVDYLVPVDIENVTRDQFTSFLVPLDFASVIEQSHLAKLSIIVDACREGAEVAPGEDSTKGGPLVEWSSGKRRLASTRDCTIVFSCGTGESSRFVPGEYSLFTKALHDALLDEDKSHWNLSESIQRHLDRIAQERGKPRQTVVPRPLSDAGDGKLAWIWNRSAPRADAQEVNEFGVVAQAYSAIRKRRTYNGNRTDALINLVNTVHRLADDVQIDATEILRFLDSGNDGLRLVGLVLLERFPNAEACRNLAAIIDSFMSSFELWHAFEACKHMAPTLGGQDRQTLIYAVKALVDANRFPRDEQVARKANEALRALGVHEQGQPVEVFPGVLLPGDLARRLGIPVFEIKPK